jgi:DDE superfamily endonuclease
VVVWDNLNTHISGPMAELITARDWLTVYQLPPYAHELNPVEPVWFSVSARDEVDTVAEAALAAGGTEADGPEDHGFMYSRSFFDLDGHGWQVMWMDPAAAPQGPGESAASMQDADAPA